MSGAIRIEYGEKGGVIPNPDEILMDGGKKQAMDLQVFEYVKVQNKRTGAVRTERGEKLVYLGEFDVRRNMIKAYQMKSFVLQQ